MLRYAENRPQARAIRVLGILSGISARDRVGIIHKVAVKIRTGSPLGTALRLDARLNRASTIPTRRLPDGGRERVCHAVRSS